MMRFAIPVLLWVGPALADVSPDPVGQLVSLGADVVILGEVHDNPHHHLRQAEAIAEIGPSAVVYEMLSPEQADLVTKAGVADPVALEWETSGWPAFDLYAPVFEAAAGVPTFGGAVPRESVRAAIGQGAAAVFASIDETGWNFGLNDPLPEAEQVAREAGQLASHCDALPPEMLPGFVEAQRLRDAALAAAVLSAFEANGRTVILITGNGHARSDWGVPAMLAIAAPELRVVSLGQFEDTVPAQAPPFDVVSTSPAAVRDDPCAAFR